VERQCISILLVGTRYKRRGVDSDGHTANYVETEQVLLSYDVFNHC